MRKIGMREKENDEEKETREAVLDVSDVKVKCTGGPTKSTVPAVPRAHTSYRKETDSLRKSGPDAYYSR